LSQSAYPRIIAHRCGGLLAPENTLAGLNAAARIGCRGVEFDVMLSADGVPVLMHDDTVDRTTNGRGAVASMTVAELRRLHVGGEPVPLLAEALDRCAQLGLWANIELKTVAGGDDGRLGQVVARMLAGAWDGHGVVSSFSLKALLAAKSQSSRHAYALLFEELATDWREQVRDTGAIGVHLDASRMTAAQCELLRGAGMNVACYTVNSRVASERLFASGVASVFSDRPDLWAADEM
jgi:glycerophosphoryl diester phosphodiesterase